VPEIPVGAEAGLFRRLARGLFRAPARSGEGAVARDAARHAPGPHAPQPHPRAFPPRNTHAELVDAVANGRDTHWLTRRALTEAGPEGMRALQTLDKYRTEIRYTRGGGSFHCSNVVHIDLDNANVAISLVHEAVHVKWFNEGIQAHPSRMGKEEYVNSAIYEESDAVARQIHATVYMQTNSPHLGLPVTRLQNEFSVGYYAGAMEADRLAQQQGRVLAPWERHMAGDAGGRNAVYYSFHAGGVRGSANGLPYPQTYADAWESYQAWQRQYGRIPHVPN
jgi:hypothetical protein